MKFTRILILLACVATFVRGATTNPIQGKPTATSPAGDDWLYIGGATNDVRKLSPTYYPSAAFVASTYLTQTNAATNYQPLDADLTALAALSGTNTIYYRSAANTWSAVTFSGATFSSGVLTVSGAAGNDETGLGVDGAGSVLTAGVVVERTVASPFTIIAWYIVTDQSGSVIMDVLKGTSSGSTTSYSSIAGSGIPAVSSADNASGNVSLWSSPTFVAGDKIRLRINGTPTSVTRATITFKITRP